MSLAVRTWLRYLVPLSLLALVALAPLLYVALTAAPAKDVHQARAQVRLGWIVAGCAWVFQLWLVAAVTPAVRGVATGAPLSQARALACGLAGLARGAVPCAIAAAAIAIGGVALVVPGVVLLVLFAMTGASAALASPPPAALVDAASAARAQLPRIAIVVGLVIAADLACAAIAQTTLVPALSRKLAAAKLLPIRAYVRVVAIAVVALSPLAACAIAAVYHGRARR